MPIAFAVIGHNEERTVARAVRCAQAAMEDGDELWFVDSASLDRTAEQARSAGAHVLHAPIGKGRAMAAFLEACDSKFACFLDADILGTELNIARRLRAAIAPGEHDMVIGQFSERSPGVLSNTIAVYQPLVGALFPEAVSCCGDKPLSGFRAVRTAAVPSELPPDFGVEAYLNISLAVRGRSTAVIDIGRYDGRFRYKPTMGLQIGTAILDLAVAEGRLDPVLRPAWEAWVEEVVEVIAENRGDPEERDLFLRKLMSARERPLPPPRTD